ncbi:hypothetical protein SSS_01100 [Sarcoptes scabiei]|uniref:Uncharacterized protein n=1 Tax=Sarcoptes scabiei TaxID=52283 RepID=A0A834RFI1_SARSC|nr:hypothetical protein SSS_01100 [Sarcoptes scabiei]
MHFHCLLLSAFLLRINSIDSVPIEKLAENRSEEIKEIPSTVPTLIRVSLRRSDDSETLNAPVVETCFKKCRDIYSKDSTTNDPCSIGCKLNKSLVNSKDLCNQTCKETYSDSPDQKACIFACAMNAEDQFEPVKTVSSVENDSSSDDKMIPVRIIGPSNDPQPSPIIKDLMSQEMRSIVTNILNRMRNLMNFARQHPTLENRVQNDQVIEDPPQSFLFKPKSEDSFSVQRSLSVLMTRDGEGHNKIVVIKPPPKITSHRNTWIPFGLPIEPMFKHQKTNQNSESKNYDNYEGESSLDNQIRLIRPIDQISWNPDNQNDHESLASKIFNRMAFGRFDVNVKDPDLIVNNKNLRDFDSWNNFFLLLTPFLYLLLIVLLLYLIVWMIYPIPNYLISRIYPRNLSRSKIVGGESSKLPESRDNFLHKYRKKLWDLYSTRKVRNYTQLSSILNNLTANAGKDQSDIPSPNASSMLSPPSYLDATHGSFGNEVKQESRKIENEP